MAKPYYISSGVAYVYEQPDSNSKKLIRLTINTKIETISEMGQWVTVKEGFIKRLFVSPNKTTRVSLLGNAGNNARIHARERASSDVTAASARGLIADKKNMRYQNANTYDIDTALSNMEKIYISEDELLSFLEQGNIK
jgi:hypothetical protein